ncbi:HAMP domain-containing protein [Gracilibacillus oryzae]|uniref:HAMP domain-containing protein n=1 Tax=Gracilibacillus oryzae TaxID=1672701 RepID=A0A7C8GUT4_9BACI|nr:HAMP domain-containing methyl-accepting chemotaxis protein [Gracilibacillus oryzae]KAB8138603.1 HAMP domain-containing protein [Gracilibacillus oryzae]
MNIKQKLRIITLLPLLIACIIMAIIVVQMTRIHSSNSEHVGNLLDVEKLNSAIVSIEQGLGSYSLNRTEADADTVRDNLDTSFHILANLDDTTNASEHVGIVDNKLHSLNEQVLEALDSKDVSEAKRQSIRTRGIQNDIHNLRLIVDQSYQQSLTKQTDVINYIIVFTIVSGLILLLGTGSFSYMMTNRIIIPIKNLVNHANEIANGNLNQTIDPTSNKDEIGQLQNSFVKMKQDLKDLIANLLETSQNIAASSDQLSINADQTTTAIEKISRNIVEMSDGSEKQLYLVQDSNQNVHQIAQDIELISSQIGLVTNSSNEASARSLEGMETITSISEQMTIINQHTEETNKVMKKLDNHSKEINKIVDLITDIAEQTNLLALNAAIEAARAGEQGKGFAVVANEVRKLAEKSGQSARQISELITKMQNTTTNIIQSMANGNKAVKQGSELVTEVNEAFDNITGGVNAIKHHMKEASSSISMINTNKDTLIKSMANVSDITETSTSYSQEVANATEEQNASIQEIAAAAKILAEMAQDLQKNVRRFNIS